MIENIRSYKLKCNHAPQRAPSEIVLEVPHARIANDEPALPSDVILEVSIHPACWSTLRHACPV